MSMFWCASCDNLRDSDDGCEEVDGFRLRCVECMDDDGTESDGRDMSYDGIYRTLTAAGCPDDIAHELAREKSR